MSELEALQIIIALLAAKMAVGMAIFHRLGTLSEKVAGLTKRVEKLEETANAIS